MQQHDDMPRSGRAGPREDPDDRQGGRRLAAAPVVLLVLCILPELVLSGADFGLWGTPRWRLAAYQWGAFWPGLLGNWRPNFPGQSVTMFVTYSFLHAGLWHLTLNMITLVSLGGALVPQLGQGRFLVLWIVSTIGGALGYAALVSSPQPMVGASGALFGLAGAVIWSQIEDLVRDREPPALVARALLQPLILLTLLNIAMYWSMNGRLAWQTHLGGFVAGALAMGVLGRGRRPVGTP